MLVPRSHQNVIKLHPDRKNRAVLRSLRPRKLVMQTMDSATRPAVDSATFTNTNRRAVSIQANRVNSVTNFLYRCPKY